MKPGLSDRPDDAPDVVEGAEDFGAEGDPAGTDPDIKAWISRWLRLPATVEE